MKKTLKVFLVVGVSSYNKGEVSIDSFNPDLLPLAQRSRMKLKELEIEVEVPDFDFNSMMVESLEAVVEKEKADYQVRQNFLLDQISKLKCITQE